jgi:cobalt-zinc-cadmium efflux system protein
MAHDHSDHHHHYHGSTKRLGLVFALNFVFAMIEVAGGLYANSVSILSDALHDFGDSLALLFALVMEKLSHKKSDGKYSYGYRRYSPLAALVTGCLLILGSVFIIVQAVPRLLNPVEPKADIMMLFAFFGIAVNGFAAYRISKGTSLNEKMVMWHLMEDVLGWVLVLISSILIYFFDVPQLDAALACVLAIWILYNVFRNIKQALRVFLQARPDHFNQDQLTKEIKAVTLVEDIHHSHIWSMDGEHHVFTTHVVLADQVTHQQIDDIKIKIKEIAKKFHILESTIEIEFKSSYCADPKH